jgi:hypothetical protein
MLPLPDDAPPVIPRLRIGDTDGKWTCQVTSDRLDCFFEPDTPQTSWQDLQDCINSLSELTVGIWGRLQAQFAATAHRVGFVSQLEAKAENPTSILRGAFFRTGCFEDSHRLEAHSLHKMELGGYSINRWVRLRAFPAASEADGEGRLGMEVDINTLPEDPVDISAETLAGFLKSALQLLTETRATFTAPMLGQEENHVSQGH